MTEIADKIKQIVVEHLGVDEFKVDARSLLHR